MRAVIQRVSSASVSVDQQVCGAIERGCLVLLGVEQGDSGDDLAWLVKKVAAQRLFPDDDGRMNLNTHDVQGSFLVISQFTLFASTRKGTRPGFSRAAEPGIAKQLYLDFCTQIRTISGCAVEQGIFAADMQV